MENFKTALANPFTSLMAKCFLMVLVQPISHSSKPTFCMNHAAPVLTADKLGPTCRAMTLGLHMVKVIIS